ncbi:hypothetical protein ACJ73_09530 [Blastomyces percursus]|uniref:Uncharacterized protein n=1 Tax=Blastomyces percursus TaxID=1658174 RepID=A0A1J9Q5E1_9EURO|nr:hypothetical protein ACJ73_09530 [Blastomyces percursus]
MSTVEEQTGVMSQSQALALEYEDQDSKDAVTKRRRLNRQSNKKRANTQQQRALVNASRVNVEEGSQHEIASEEENTDEEGHEGDEPGLPPAPQNT